jgi:aldose 1-epimerase
MRVTRREFGLTQAGECVHEYVIEDPNSKVSVTLITYGATITRLLAPDRTGQSEDVTLCFDTLEDLEVKTGPYYGCIAGRVANRIKDGTFHLDGETYKLAVNNGPNHLHGGIIGFDKKVWVAEEIPLHDGKVGVKMSCISRDGEEGYPGELNVRNCNLLIVLCRVLLSANN